MAGDTFLHINYITMATYVLFLLSCNQRCLTKHGDGIKENQNSLNASTAHWYTNGVLN
jgi:hypothetical protein